MKNILVFSIICIVFTGIAESASTKISADSGLQSVEDQLTNILAYVNDSGMVDYSSLHRRKELLVQFEGLLNNISEVSFKILNQQEKIAFWINAYNGLTIKVIVDNYPIQSSFISSLRFPKNSIRQISGAWDSKRFGVTGKKLTLDDIEHNILRSEFDEPRIHLALVCAAKSCPALRNEPYTGNELDKQLNAQTEKFLKNPQKFRIDRKTNTVYLSKILDWYGKDFLNKYKDASSFEGKSQIQKAVLNFLSLYLPQNERQFLLKGDFRIRYLEYDWTLNEQKQTQ